MSSPNHPIEKRYSIKSEAGVFPHRVVVYGDSAGAVTLPSGVNAGSIAGVSLNSASRDLGVGVRKSGSASVEAAGLIKVGDPVIVADRHGRVCSCAIPAQIPNERRILNPAAMFMGVPIREPFNCLGFAETAAKKAGDIIEVFISIHQRFREQAADLCAVRSLDLGPAEGPPVPTDTPKAEPQLSDDQFRALLNLFMASDPWPIVNKGEKKIARGIQDSGEEEELQALLTDESHSRGYAHWTDAFHNFTVGGETSIDFGKTYRCSLVGGSNSLVSIREYNADTVRIECLEGDLFLTEGTILICEGETGSLPWGRCSFVQEDQVKARG